MNIAALDHIEDYEMRLARQTAWWDGAILDRPVVLFQWIEPKEGKRYEEERDKRIRGLSWESIWTHSTLQAELAAKKVHITNYRGDALPVVYPDLGPDFFASIWGGTLHFMETTSYIEPYISHYNELSHAVSSKASNYSHIMKELYDALFALHDGQFYIGWPDLHPGADCLVGMRGPEQLSLDLIEQPDAVKQAIHQIEPLFESTYHQYANMLTAYGQPSSGWPRIVSVEPYHVASCDFSCMISTTMFEEFFLDSLIDEIKSVERTIYHLDGPGALRHLDTLLAIEELDAVQWVYGAGNGRASDHIPIYQKIQQKEKQIQIFDVFPDEIDLLCEYLDPHGAWMNVIVSSDEEVEFVMKAIIQWRKK